MNEKKTNENQGLNRGVLLSEYLKPDPVIKIFTITSLLFGGLIFLSYFTHINFMPKMDFQSSILLIAIAAITGSLISLSLSLCLIFPASSWLYMISKNVNINCFIEKKNQAKSTFWFIPFVLFLVGVLLAFVASFSSRFNQIILFLLIMIPPLFSRLVLLYEKRNLPDYNINHSSTPKTRSKKNLPVSYSKHEGSKELSLNPITALILGIIKGVKSLGLDIIGLFLADLISYFFTIFTWVLLYLVLASEQVTSNTSTSRILAITVIALASLLTNFMLISAAKDVKSFLQFIGIGLLVLFCILITLNSIVVVPKGIMRLYGWGDISNAVMLVNHQGCQVLQSYGVKTKPLQCSDKESLYEASNMKILSAIGETYYLGYQAKNGFAKFELPKNVVISLGITEK